MGRRWCIELLGRGGGGAYSWGGGGAYSYWGGEEVVHIAIGGGEEVVHSYWAGEEVYICLGCYSKLNNLGGGGGGGEEGRGVDNEQQLNYMKCHWLCQVAVNVARNWLTSFGTKMLVLSTQ